MGYEAQWDPSAQIILCLKEAIYLLPDDRGGWRLGAGHHTLPARCCELLFNVHVDSLFHLLARTPRGVGKHIGVGADQQLTLHHRLILQLDLVANLPQIATAS